MIKRAFIEGFRKSAKGNNNDKGNRVYKNDLVCDVETEKYTSEDGDKISILSTVISENLFNEYSCKMDIEKDSKNLLFTHCTCKDFEKHEKAKNYCCKHLVAVFYKFLEKLDSDLSVKEKLDLYEESKESIIEKTEGSILDFLIGEEENQKKDFKIEVIINKVSWSNKLTAEFKIGENTRKMYSLRDINNFLLALTNNIPIPYGKSFMFDIKKYKISPEIMKLIKFIKMLKDIDLTSYFKKSDENYVSSQNIVLPKPLIKEFFEIIKPFRVYLGDSFYSRIVETEIINSDIPLPLKLKKVSNMIKLEAERGMPENLGESSEAFLYNTSIYLPSEKQTSMILPYLEAFSHSSSIFFTEKEESRVLNKLIPRLQKVTPDFEMSKSISEKVVTAPANFKFYFDKKITKESNDIVLKLMLSYDKYEFNYFEGFSEKVIYRDTEKENNVINKIRQFGFEPVNNIFMFFKGESDAFNFFKFDIKELQDIGEVYYSDRFKGINNITKGSFKADVSKGKFDYLEMNFKIEDVPEDETTNILKSFRDNKKFYRLKNGEFLDLENIELKKFLKLLDSLNDNSQLDNGTIKFNKNKAVFAADYLENEEITYINGKEELDNIRNSLKDLKNKAFPLPANLNAKLRPYQVYGYNYLKTLNYLGFGGILGDEMGLGKTIQTISFIISDKEAKTLIVAPTSLVYNWASEFDKFTKNIKVCPVVGTKDHRRRLLKNLKSFDVYITTYNLLRRDIELYKSLEFTYCILDEAQNIKNPESQNAKSAKIINSKNRFALTGTPIENSLMELWSIFDFIMPGYLYDEKRFRTRYERKLDEDAVLTDDLNILIKPFILRRYKKDVLKDLPNKIENKLVVPMEGKQKQVYETYVNHVRDIIDKKVQDDEFKSSKIEILSYIMKLRQICLHPAVIMDNYKGGSGKFNALLDLLNQSISEGHKILLFSQFTSILALISKMLKKENISFSYLDGKTSTKDRIKLVNNFNSDNTSIFLISLKAGGTGLNLTSADIVIHFDPWWNPAVEDQATDRAHRIGQQNVVEVIKMVSEGTIEEKILMLQDKKKELINKVLGNDSNELGMNFKNLSDDELLSLFCR